MTVNEDKAEKENIKNILEDHHSLPPHQFISILPASQYADDITGYSKEKLQQALQEEFDKLTQKDLYIEVLRDSLSDIEKKNIVKTRWVITDRPEGHQDYILKARW